MDLIVAAWTFLTDSVLPYAQYIWPFVTATLVSMIVGQMLSHRLWTRENAARARWIAIGRSTVPLHPIIAGAALGLVWPNPCGDTWPAAQSMAYFMLSGIAAFVGYLFIDKWVEKRFGVDLDVLFDESTPPAAPSDAERDAAPDDSPSDK